MSGAYPKENIICKTKIASRWYSRMVSKFNYFFLAIRFQSTALIVMKNPLPTIDSPSPSH